jgi:hypothetical protein
MVQFSDELMGKMYGDEAVLNYIGSAHDAFLAGNKGALFGVIYICAQFQAVIPEWAVDEIFKIDQSLIDGTLKDYNEAFGWQTENQATRKKEARLKNLTNSVLLTLSRLRNEGASLNADDIMATAADELKISRRDVEDIYKQSGQFIKDMPKGNPENINYAQCHVVIPSHRRSGRPILRD